MRGRRGAWCMEGIRGEGGGLAKEVRRYCQHVYIIARDSIWSVNENNPKSRARTGHIATYELML
jgi:hypothetical protein